MDPTEDVSARILLRNILITEPPRSPVSRSASAAPGASGTRRTSGRPSKKDAGAQTPRDLLRRSLKTKMRESVTRKSLAAAPRTSARLLGKMNTPGSASMMFDEGDTPRHILRNILMTEPVRSPVVHAEAEEPPVPSANSSVVSKRPSIELSGLDLPDLTIGNIASVAKGLSRKRPRRSLNVTAFEKRLKDGGDVEEESEESVDDHSSLSLSSSTTLSLKTPFVDPRSEKRGLQRRVTNRRKITEEEFGAAVNIAHGTGNFVPPDPNNYQNFTLCLSRCSEPDITTDIVNCNTALYSGHDSIVVTQDKPTTIASLLQGQMRDMEQSKLGKNTSMYLFPTEKRSGNTAAQPGSTTEVEPDFRLSLSHDGANPAEDGERLESQTEGEDAANIQADSGGEGEEEEGGAESQTEEDEEVVSQSDLEGVEPEAGTEGLEEEDGVTSQHEQDVEAGSPSAEEEVEPESEMEGLQEEDGVNSPHEEDVEDGSQTAEEEVEPESPGGVEEEGGLDSQPEENIEAGSQSEGESSDEVFQNDQMDHAANSEEGRSMRESRAEEEHDGKQRQEEEEGEPASEDLERNVEQVSHRAHRSEGRLILPLEEAGRYSPDATETGGHADPNKENSFPPLEGMDEIVEGGQPSDASTDESAAPLPVDLEEESEDEVEEDDDEGEEFPSEMPAFVKEKRNFSYPKPLASTSVLDNIETSTSKEASAEAKPKQVRRRKSAGTPKVPSLTKKYVMDAFRHFAKTKVSTDVYPVLKETMEKFFERLSSDLETYAGHARRKTIEVEDAVLLLKRQGYVTDAVPVEVLIEKYLRMEQRKLLIPIATSGNVVVPKQRR